MLNSVPNFASMSMRGIIRVFKGTVWAPGATATAWDPLRRGHSRRRCACRMDSRAAALSTSQTEDNVFCLNDERDANCLTGFKDQILFGAPYDFEAGEIDSQKIHTTTQEHLVLHAGPNGYQPEVALVQQRI